MSDRNLFTLPRPPFTPIDHHRVAQLNTIVDHIEALEREGQNVLSLLGVVDRSEPPEPPAPDLPELTELHRWSNFSGALLAAYHTRTKWWLAEQAELYSDHVRVLEEVRTLDELQARLRRELRWTRVNVSRWILGLTIAHLDHAVLTNGALRWLKTHFEIVHDMWIALMKQTQEVAHAIDWVETVTRNRVRLSPGQIRVEHENNLYAIRQLGTDPRSGHERVAAGALGIARQTLDRGDSVAVGKIDSNPAAARKWLANNISELARSGAKFLQLDLPKANQEALREFLESHGTAADQATLFDELQRTGTPRRGWAADSAFIEMIQKAHRSGLDVVAGAPMVHAEHAPDRRETAVPYLAAMHAASVDKYGGPGIILTDRWNTNVVDGGLERHLPGLVSIDQAFAADLLPGEAIITPWSGRDTASARTDPEPGYEGHVDSSTVLFNPQPR